jgi:hypothetical protein
MQSRFGLVLLAVGTLGSGTAIAAPAKDKAQPLPPEFSRLMACRSIADSAQRLACYDREIAVVGSANARGDIVVVNREEIRKTRRSLFGLALPDLGVFGGGELPGDAARLETTIKQAKQGPNGKWLFVLAEGGQWVQLDSQDFIVDPAPGQRVRIKRGALGSFMMNVNDQHAVSVHRIN